MRDGTNTNAISLPLINWIGGYDASPSPLSLPQYWLWSYEDFPEDTYSAWNQIGAYGNLNVGLAFTMKGSGAASTNQNYVFVGKPNNGTITNSVSVGHQVLAGNPYPSAIDAIEFIKDNIPAGASANSGTSESIDGTLYFWEHYTSNVTHILEDYEGGYATFNLTGGNQAVSPPLISGLGTPSLMPQRYIPVSQGFFVTASNSAGNITFKNSQRAYVKETSGNSQFFRNLESNSTTNEVNAIKRLRFDYEGADGFHRYLLLGFAGDDFASDDFDYGYDAEVTELMLNDIGFEIDGKNYSTQGVGDFDTSKIYPMSVYADISGTITLKLTQIENFEEAPEVFIYDALLDTFTLINYQDFEIVIGEGVTTNRFYIVFDQNNSTLSTNGDLEGNNTFSISYFQNDQDIFIASKQINDIRLVELFSMSGQKVRSFDSAVFELDLSSQSLRIPISDISEGVYIIKCHTSNSTHNDKVVIKL